MRIKDVKHIQQTQAEFRRDHNRSMNRRDMIGHGLLMGTSSVAFPGITELLASKAYASCVTEIIPNTMIPILIYDLVGGANIAGSNVLVGKNGAQEDFLSAGAYSTLGLPASMHPGNPGMVDDSLGIKFHSKSAMLAGIKSITTASTRAKTTGIVFAASSQDDTTENQHNPMFWVYAAGGRGSLSDLAGMGNRFGRSTPSGGSSRMPLASYRSEARPVCIRSAADAMTLIVSSKSEQLAPGLSAKIMAAAKTMSTSRLQKFLATDFPSQVQELVSCNYMKSIDKLSRFGLDDVDFAKDAALTQIAAAPFAEANAADPKFIACPPKLSSADFGNPNPYGAYINPLDDDDRNDNDPLIDSNPNAGDTSPTRLEQEATIAKLVLDGYCAAGTITISGCDYHGQPDRGSQDIRDFAIGRSIGLALEMAAKKGKPLAIYAFSDGGVVSSASSDVDGTALGGDKLKFGTDSGSRSAAIMLVYNPGGRVNLVDNLHQVGSFNDSGEVEMQPSKGGTLISQDVVNLSKAMLANYLALHGRTADLEKITENPFGSDLERYIKFAKII